VEVSGGLILVRVVCDGPVRAIWHLALDSGISQILIFAQRIKVGEFLNQQPGALVTSAAGTRAAASVKIASLQIGAITLKDCAALVLPSEMSSRNPAEDGLLPASLFRSVYFDRDNMSLALSLK
jgi:predicted aspartyl protease